MPPDPDMPPQPFGTGRRGRGNRFIWIRMNAIVWMLLYENWVYPREFTRVHKIANKC
jgi:hypothetical protein